MKIMRIITLECMRICLSNKWKNKLHVIRKYPEEMFTDILKYIKMHLLRLTDYK